jgi:hypothetical protein
MTRGDEILQGFEAAREALRALCFRPHARHDIANIVDPLGSRTETFLRTAALPSSSHRQKFFDLINDLAPAGVPATDIANLHRLRLLYNTSKHDPAAPIHLVDAMEIVRNAAGALSAIVALGLGATQVPFERELNYHLWVAFWDHYHSGDTDIAVMLPSDRTHIGTVDVFHMDISDWNKLKPVLLAHPRFRLGEAQFEPAVWHSFREEGDFLNAGIWSGDYGELIRLLAAFEDREVMRNLLPSSSRTANATSVAVALVTAAVDVARAATVVLTLDQLVTQITQRADQEYAMPSDNGLVRNAAIQIGALVAGVPFDRWRHLVGPVLVARPRNAQPAAPLAAPLPLELDGGAVVVCV